MTQRDRTYTLGGVIKEGISRALAEVHTACAGRIVRYDAAKQLADVKPLVQITYYDESGAAVTESLPVVPNVPVVFPGAGGFRITFPVKADDQTGDTVLLVFAEGSIDRWLASGGNDVDPQDERRFHLSDGIAILGLRDFAHALKAAPTDRMTVGDDAGLQMHIDGTSIRIGANDSPSLDAAALGTATTNALAACITYVQTHTHVVAGVTPGPGSVTSAPTASPPPSLPNVKSSAVMVKV